MDAEKRSKLACVISAMSELTAESDARLSRIVGVNRTNMTAFVSGKRLSAISMKSAEELLRRYGFVWANERVEPADTFTCPVLRLMRAQESDQKKIKEMVDLFTAQGMKVAWRPVAGLEPGEFVLTIRGAKNIWCAVALFDEVGKSELLNLIKELGVTRQPSLKVDRKTVQAWRQCGPRKNEVQDLIHH